MIRLSSRAVRAAALLILMTAARAAHAQATPMQGDGTPQPIVWFRADSLRALAANAPVTHWPDSTNATGSEAVAQTGADAGQPPTYSLTGVGGKPAVHFAASRRTRLTFPRPVQDDEARRAATPASTPSLSGASSVAANPRLAFRLATFCSART